MIFMMQYAEDEIINDPLQVQDLGVHPVRSEALCPGRSGLKLMLSTQKAKGLHSEKILHKTEA